REQRAELAALGDAGMLERAARQARDQRRRLAVQPLQILVRKVGDRRGRGNAVARKMRHQVEIERQLGGRQALEQREHVAPLRGGDQGVAVYNSCLVRLDWLQPPDRDRKSTRLNSSHEWISYAVFCLNK